MLQARQLYQLLRLQCRPCHAHADFVPHCPRCFSFMTERLEVTKTRLALYRDMGMPIEVAGLPDMILQDVERTLLDTSHIYNRLHVYWPVKDDAPSDSRIDQGGAYDMPPDIPGQNEAGNWAVGDDGGFDGDDPASRDDLLMTFIVFRCSV